VLVAIAFTLDCRAETLLPTFPCAQVPRTERTGVLKSNDGVRAFLEVSVKVSLTRRNVDGDISHKCDAVWILHVAEQGENSFRQYVVHTSIEPEFTSVFGADSSLYFGGGVLEWSADGNLLLMQAQIGGSEDWFALTPIVYRRSDRRWWATDLVKLYERQHRLNSRPCPLFTHVVGFSADNRVLVEAEPFEWAESKYCFPKGAWLLDFEAGSIERRSSRKLE
jgi:hypothetical protein